MQCSGMVVKTQIAIFLAPASGRSSLAELLSPSITTVRDFRNVFVGSSDCMVPK